MSIPRLPSHNWTVVMCLAALAWPFSGSAQTAVQPCPVSQTIVSPIAMTCPPVVASVEITTIDMAGAGITGALLGAAGGWFLGRYGFDSIEMGLAAAAAGESLALPLAVHLRNGSRGSYARSSVISAGIAAAAFLFVLYDRSDRSVITAAVLTPLIQLPIVIAIERTSSR